MNLRLFFALPFHEEKFPFDVGIKNVFDKRFIYEEEFFKVKVRVVCYVGNMCYIFLAYKYSDSILSTQTYLAEWESFNDKILVKNILHLPDVA